MTAKSGSQVFVVGAGLAGLSAAVELARQNVKVTLIEGAMQAGGRCRSYVDPVLDMTIDNGNHFVLSGNAATFAYLKVIGAEDRLIGLDAEGPSFYDLNTDETWTLRPNSGALAWWVLAKNRRVRGTRAADYLSLAALIFPPKGKRIDQVMACQGPLWERLLGPFLLGALNTDPKAASADLAAAVIRKTFARGGKYYRPRIAHPTLAAAFVEPALAYLALRGARVSFGRRVKALAFTDNLAVNLTFGEARQDIPTGAAVILAAPPWAAQEILPDLKAPDRHSAIVNAHFRIQPPSQAAPMLGVIGGTAEWVFAFQDRLSVTISGADAIVDEDREVLARRIWADVAKVYRLPADLPPWQIVKERRATFTATPEQNARRPPARTVWRNLFLAGDWTDTGLPGTIEGAIQSGVLAAQLALKSFGKV